MEYNIEKDRTKIWIVIALVIAILALSIGFAAFSATLTINPGSDKVTITPFDNFSNSVVFDTGSLSCTVKNGENESKGSIDSSGTITDTIWSGLTVTLREPNDVVTCTVPIKNKGEYNAYLKDIKFNTTISCKSATAGNIYTSEICGASGIHASAAVADYSSAATVNTSTINSQTNITTNNLLESQKSKVLTVKITYPAGAPYADEDIQITIPQITLTYSSSNS